MSFTHSRHAHTHISMYSHMVLIWSSTLYMFSHFLNFSHLVHLILHRDDLKALHRPHEEREVGVGHADGGVAR